MKALLARELKTPRRLIELRGNDVDCFELGGDTKRFVPTVSQSVKIKGTYCDFITVYRSSRASYGDDAISYVQLKRDAHLCTVKCKMCPEHKVHAKLYGCTLIIDEEDDVIVSVVCEDCVASRALIEKVKEETIEQSKSNLWFELRYGRITASKAYEVSRCKTADGTLVSLILGGKIPETKHMKRGRVLEDQSEDDLVCSECTEAALQLGARTASLFKRVPGNNYSPCSLSALPAHPDHQHSIIIRFWENTSLKRCRLMALFGKRVCPELPYRAGISTLTVSDLPRLRSKLPIADPMFSVAYDDAYSAIDKCRPTEQ
ncbi:hypothetical protein EVAR_55827_1 [Eumeta japonica]|uniref:YqaJ viral recombinase domain-containing protein n=1 Tax=Eumeta variegata TaxID=151549 RepID=A0A4C1YT91_EUMVA|nr:hypothetical protein EVAR_55827_1 [Eumeta japonica]